MNIPSNYSFYDKYFPNNSKLSIKEGIREAFSRYSNIQNIYPKEERFNKLREEIISEKYSLYLSARHLVSGDLVDREAIYAIKVIAKLTGNVLCQVSDNDKNNPLYGKVLQQDQYFKIVNQVAEDFFSFTNDYQDRKEEILVPNGIFGKRVNSRTEEEIFSKIDSMVSQIPSLGVRELTSSRGYIQPYCGKPSFPSHIIAFSAIIMHVR